jgi:hypothetical protein
MDLGGYWKEDQDSWPQRIAWATSLYSNEMRYQFASHSTHIYQGEEILCLLG